MKRPPTENLLADIIIKHNKANDESFKKVKKEVKKSPAVFFGGIRVQAEWS